MIKRLWMLEYEQTGNRFFIIQTTMFAWIWSEHLHKRSVSDHLVVRCARPFLIHFIQFVLVDIRSKSAVVSIEWKWNSSQIHAQRADFPTVLIHISFITLRPATWAASRHRSLRYNLDKVFSICIHKLISTICIGINDLCHREWFSVTIKRLAVQHKDPFVLSTKVECLAKSHDSDSHVPLSKICHRGLRTHLLGVYTARRPLSRSYCSSEELYLLSHTYSKENKCFDLYKCCW